MMITMDMGTGMVTITDITELPKRKKIVFSLLLCLRIFFCAYLKSYFIA